MKLMKALACVAALATPVLPAQAATLFEFYGTGVVTGTNTQVATDAGIAVGDFASLRFTFDADTPDSNSDRFVGEYDNAIVGPVVGVFGPETFRTSGTSRLSVTEQRRFPSIDSFNGRTDTTGTSDSGALTGVRLAFVFQDFRDETISSDALLTELPFTGFEVAEFGVFQPDTNVEILATFSSASITPVVPVPLPASIPLLLAGLGALALLRRRRELTASV